MQKTDSGGGRHVRKNSKLQGLEIWKRGVQIAKAVYLLTRKLPREELFGLCSQMRRAAVSVPSNIAEGHAKSTAHYQNHLEIALGSIAELDTQLLLTGELYPQVREDTDAISEELDAEGRMVQSLLQKLRG